MVQYDRYPNTGSLPVDLRTANARIDDSTIVAPTTLAPGDVGHITGTVTNIGNTSLTLIIELWDADTNSMLDSLDRFVTPPFPVADFDLAFTMPNRNFNWFLVLRD